MYEGKKIFFSCLPIDKITFTLYNVDTKKEIGKENREMKVKIFKNNEMVKTFNKFIPNYNAREAIEWGEEKFPNAKVNIDRYFFVLYIEY